MGRPRQTKLDAIRFVAYRDNESKEFDSRRAANLFVSTARRSSRVEPLYWKCRYWVLECERVPAESEEHLDYEDYSRLRFWEREAVLKGADPDDLSIRAEAIRRASFEKYWLELRDDANLRQLPPDSRRLALETRERFYDRLDDSHDRKEAEKERKRVEAERLAALAAIPTVGAIFEQDVEKRVASGRIQRNTADVYRY